MKAQKPKVRLPQRSETVAGDEAKGMKPIAAAQKKNRTMRPARDAKAKIDRPPKTGR